MQTAQGVVFVKTAGSTNPISVVTRIRQLRSLRVDNVFLLDTDGLFSKHAVEFFGTRIFRSVQEAVETLHGLYGSRTSYIVDVDHPLSRNFARAVTGNVPYEVAASYLGEERRYVDIADSRDVVDSLLHVGVPEPDKSASDATEKDNSEQRAPEPVVVRAAEKKESERPAARKTEPDSEEKKNPAEPAPDAAVAEPERKPDSDESSSYSGPLAVVMTTRNRTDVACACLRSLKENLLWDDIRWIVSDDRSEPGHVDSIARFMRDIGFDMSRVTIRTTGPVRYGLGASLNAGMREAFSLSDMVLRTEDDWFLTEPLYVKKYADVLTDPKVAGIRMGYCTNQPTEESVWPGFLKVSSKDGRGSGKYIFNNQVMFVHRRAYDAAGEYSENTDSRYVEDRIAEAYGSRTGYGRLPPYVLLDRAFSPWELNNGSPFIHIGDRSTLGHRYDSMDERAAPYAEEARRTVASSDGTVLHYALVANDGYVDKVAATIRSIDEHTPAGMSAVVHLVTMDDLSDGSMELLGRAARRVDVAVSKAPPEIIKEGTRLDPSKRLGVEAPHTGSKEFGMAHLVVKLYLPEMLGLDRFIYVDGDVIQRGDPTELWFTDTSDRAVVAVKDAWNMKDPERRRSGYLNSGVMLVDSRRWRDMGITRKCVRLAESVHTTFPFDQNLINEALDGAGFGTVPLRYNLPIQFVARTLHRHPGNVERLNEMYGTRYSSLDQIVSDAVFVHFCTSAKPWTTGCYGEDIWHHYRDQLR